MRRAIIILAAALMLSAPQIARAQYADTDRQNPSEYTDEDSHPLRVAAYILAPVGFLLEWTVARPIHYIATDTFLAPVFNGDVSEPTYTPPAIAEIPLDDVGDEALPPTEVTPAPPVRSQHAPLSESPAPIRQGQSALH
jgi:hypothetical protein